MKKNQQNFNFERYFSQNKGSSQWGDPEALKHAPTVKRINIEDDDCLGSGIPILSNGRIAYVDSSDTHSLIFGATGSKKTRLFGMPLINFFALAGESFIATDPKGELYARTSGLVAAKGYKTVTLNFRDLPQSDFWNPLKLPYEIYHRGKRDEATSLLNDFLSALAAPQRIMAKDPYFIELGYSMALAYLLFFIETSTPEEANIYSFINFFTSKSSPEATEEISNYMVDGSIASVNLKGVLINKDAKNTFANVAACVSAMINPFIIQKNLCSILSKSSFDIRDIGKEKNAVYLIVPDEKTTLHFLVTAFIKQTYEVLIHEAQQREDKKLPVRVNFLLDEFGNMPTINDMASITTAARSRHMRFFLMVQGMYQMRNKYGVEAETIKGNCDNWIFLNSREYELLKEISDLCGETFYNDQDGNLKSRPLVSISELQKLNKEKGETLIIHGRNDPFVTELPDIDEYMFKFYPPVKKTNNKLPQIPIYKADDVISEIKNKKRPLPFSVEVFGKEKYYDKSPSASTSDDVWDW